LTRKKRGKTKNHACFKMKGEGVSKTERGSWRGEKNKGLEENREWCLGGESNNCSGLSSRKESEQEEQTWGEKNIQNKENKSTWGPWKKEGGEKRSIGGGKGEGRQSIFQKKDQRGRGNTM